MSTITKGGKKKIKEITEDLDDLDRSSDMSDSSDGEEKKESSGGKKRKYNVISQNVREKFVKRALSKEVTIKEVNLNMSFEPIGCKRIRLEIFHRQGYLTNLQERGTYRQKEKP
jgi:hypothetical protein